MTVDGRWSRRGHLSSHEPGTRHIQPAGQEMWLNGLRLQRDAVKQEVQYEVLFACVTRHFRSDRSLTTHVSPRVSGKSRVATCRVMSSVFQLWFTFGIASIPFRHFFAGKQKFRGITSKVLSYKLKHQMILLWGIHVYVVKNMHIA